MSNLKSASRKQSRSTLTQSRSASVDQSKEKSLSPSTDESHMSTFTHWGKLSTVSTNTSQGEVSWSHLPPEQVFYLDFHHQCLSHHHYFFKHDSSNFIRSTLIEIALTYEPLLYAVIGFAAFHYTVGQANGKLADFLGYYNKSVSLLRKSLQSSQPHSEATIITILQLAAFEVGRISLTWYLTTKLCKGISR